MSHTPGLLDIKPYVDAIDLVAPDGTVVAHMADRDIRLEGMPPDNARRIRDCWNACEGLTDEQVRAIQRLIAWYTVPCNVDHEAWKQEWIELEKLFPTREAK